MCGRVNVYDHSGIQELLDKLGVPIWPQSEPRFNIAPTQMLEGIIRSNGGLQHQKLHWGIVPAWARPGQFKSPLINARCETIFEKASFKNLIKHQRTVIPVNGFYEWQRTPYKKIPYYISASDSKMLFLAGIYQNQSDSLPSCCLITTHANEKMQEIHSRMPVIISEDNINTWLTIDSADSTESLMKPVIPKVLTQYPVSTFVNSARNNSEQCMQEVIAYQ